MKYIQGLNAIFWVPRESIGSRGQQIAWTSNRFSWDVFVPHVDSFPMDPEKIYSFFEYFKERPFF